MNINVLCPKLTFAIFQLLRENESGSVNYIYTRRDIVFFNVCSVKNKKKKIEINVS
jgi:hypothetical protein